MDIVTLDQYADLIRPDIQWLVHGMVPRPGFVALIGEARAGKSFLALQLGLAVARGELFLGHRCEKGRVLYLQFDTSEVVWRDRLLDLRRKGIDLAAAVYMIHPACQPTWVNIQQPEIFHALEAAILAADPHLIIIDVLREIHRADENDSTEMKVVCDSLRRLGAGRSVLLIHHCRKMGPDDERDPLQVLRGSNYITGMTDSLWLLDRGHLYLRPRFTKREQLALNQLSSGFFSTAAPRYYDTRTNTFTEGMHTPTATAAEASPPSAAGATPA